MSGDGHLPVAGGVFNGVIQKVENHTSQESFIGANGQLFGHVRIDRDVLRQRQRTGGVDAVCNQLVEIEVTPRQWILTGVSAGQSKKVLDNLSEPLRLIAKHR